MSSMIVEEEVRRRISTDHAVLRSLCRAVIGVARTAASDAAQRPVIRDVLGQLRNEVERHFRYEEEVVVPLLNDVDAWGPVRVESLHEVHDHQRAVLASLTADVERCGRDLRDVADELVRFFQRFEQEMADEEARLLSAECVGAEPLVDQIDG